MAMVSHLSFDLIFLIFKAICVWQSAVTISLTVIVIAQFEDIYVLSELEKSSQGKRYFHKICKNCSIISIIFPL